MARDACATRGYGTSRAPAARSGWGGHFHRTITFPLARVPAAGAAAWAQTQPSSSSSSSSAAGSPPPASAASPSASASASSAASVGKREEPQFHGSWGTEWCPHSQPPKLAACRREVCRIHNLPNAVSHNRSRAHVGLNVGHDREAPVLLHEVAIGWLEEAVHHSKVEGRAGATGLLALVRDALRPIGLRGHSDSRSFGDYRLGPCRAPQTLTRKGDVRRVTWPPRT